MLPITNTVFKHNPLKNAKVKILDGKDEYKLDISKKMFDEFLIAGMKQEDYRPTKNPERNIYIQSIGMISKIFTPLEHSRKMLQQILRDYRISNAWQKLYEILTIVPEITNLIKNSNKLYSAHIAEFPGSFIPSTRYFIEKNNPKLLDNWDWIGTTLDPFNDSDNNTALSDYYHLYRDNKDHWRFVDCTKEEDIEKLVDEFSKNTMSVNGDHEPFFDLVTGDIGIDVERSWKFKEHELHLFDVGQLITAMAILREGGYTILKLFNTHFEAGICMLRLACGLFETVRIMKPYTSRLINEECYWVCSGFKRSEYLKYKKSIYEMLLHERNSFFNDFRYICKPFLEKSVVEDNKEFLDTLYYHNLGRTIRYYTYSKIIIGVYNKHLKNNEDDQTKFEIEMQQRIPKEIKYSGEFIINDWLRLCKFN